MDNFDILEQWAKYSEYDNKQTTFDLSSWNYELHETNKKIETILKQYDSSGNLAILFAKNMFEKILKNTKISIFDVLSNNNIEKETKNMYNCFNSSTVLQSESSYINFINNVADKVIKNKLIGDNYDNTTKENLFECISDVFNSVDRCNEDIFLKGKEIKSINNFSTNVHVFNTLAQCLTTLENSEDGLYLCYININNSADSYFGFYLKSNGNVISINERINEAYQGSHSNSRNNSWAENKKYNLFPYEYMISYSEHDYKGYATKHMINEEKLNFFNLGEKAYTPIIVAMLMINQKYCNKKIDGKLKYVDSLLEVNVNKLLKNDNKNQIIEIKNSLITTNHKSLDLSFDDDAVLSGYYSDAFTNNSNYLENGCFGNENQLFVDLWGQGFKHSNDIYESNSLLRLSNSDGEVTSEFVGTKKRFELQGYYKLRQELATYIRQQIYEEWVSIGKTKEIKKWYFNLIEKNKDKIEKLIIERYIKILSGDKEHKQWDQVSVNCRHIYDESYTSPKIEIAMVNETFPRDAIDMKCLSKPYKIDNSLNEARYEYYYDYREHLCDITGTKCTMYFVIKPQDWKAIEFLVGENVPKIVNGWLLTGHRRIGNHILDVTDEVTSVGTPFEKYEDDSELYNKESHFNFCFSIGYSKRGFNQILKKYKNVKS